MSVDDIVKLLLALAVSSSLVVISYEIARLIGKLADTVQDLRRAVQNVSTASDMVLEDYQQVRKILQTFTDIVENFEENILSPMRLITNLLQAFVGNKSRKDDKSDL